MYGPYMDWMDLLGMMPNSQVSMGGMTPQMIAPQGPPMGRNKLEQPSGPTIERASRQFRPEAAGMAIE